MLWSPRHNLRPTILGLWQSLVSIILRFPYFQNSIVNYFFCDKFTYFRETAARIKQKFLINLTFGGKSGIKIGEVFRGIGLRFDAQSLRNTP